MNKTFSKRLAALSLCAAMAFALAACGHDEPEPDPHEGMAYVNTGASWEWIYPAEGVAVSDFREEEFDLSGEIPEYTGSGYDTRLGIDVSFYQGDIDWETLAENDIKFVFIKATEGSTERSYRLYLSGDYEEYDIWIRNVITEPSLSDGREWTFWQYTDREVLDGYIGDEEHIDVNVFNGSSEEFEAYLAEKSYKNRDNEQ